MASDLESRETVRDLLLRLQSLFNSLRQTVAGDQGGVPTFYNVMARNVRLRLESLPPDAPWHERLEPFSRPLINSLIASAERLESGRFVSWQDRVGTGLKKRDLGDLAISVSQGTTECMQWKGAPVFKTVYEFSIYPMILYEVRPATLIELGSGTGSSAVWYSDLLKQYDNPAHVYSLDIKKPDLEYTGVTFIEADIFSIDGLAGQFESLPRPWVVIEDAHVNVDGVLACMHKMLEKDDYLVIEDSSGKQSIINDFMQAHGNDYRIDTRYVDFFGMNVTSAMNSVFKRI